MQEEAEDKDDRGRVHEAEPHRVSLERVGWRIMHQAPGDPMPTETGKHVDKTGATKLAVDAAQQLANNTGQTVELHTQDAQGRPSGTRYFDPTLPENGGAQ